MCIPPLSRLNANADVILQDADDNPYHRLFLEGHGHAVRGLAVRGRTLVSGSFDCTVRVWDLVTAASKWIMVGHMQKGRRFPSR
jgi:F-box and WD-40 domain protein CDC4